MIPSCKGADLWVGLSRAADANEGEQVSKLSFFIRA